MWVLELLKKFSWFHEFLMSKLTVTPNKSHTLATGNVQIIKSITKGDFMHPDEKHQN